MNQELYEQVRALVLKHCPRSKLMPETRLDHDLKMAGIDAERLLEEYAEKFGVDLSEFVFEDYFLPEQSGNPLAPLVWLWCLIFDRQKLEESEKVPLTIADLVEAAEKKKWVPKRTLQEMPMKPSSWGV